jgi:hypothetical protein
MWRDELQAWWLAQESSTLGILFNNLRYEGHPGLWHLCLWLIGSMTRDPMWMKFFHGVVGSAIYLLIAFRSPFDIVEKLLIFSGYYLSFEYTVVSRNYGIGMLLAVMFVHIRLVRPNWRLLPWALLGLLANANIYGTLFAIVLAAMWLLTDRRRWRENVAGAIIFIGLVILAIATMTPAADRSQDPAMHWVFGFDAQRIMLVVRNFSLLPFIPFRLDFPDKFWPISFTKSYIINFLLFPIALAPYWIFRKDLDLILIFSLTTLSSILFAYIFYVGQTRHFGIVMIAFLCCYWIHKVRHGRTSLLAVLLLGLSTMAGLEVGIGSQLRPFSQSLSTANWIKQRNLSDEFWMGSTDYSVSAVAGYLMKPIFYLECMCESTFVHWSNRIIRFESQEVLQKIVAGLSIANRQDAYVLLSYRLSYNEFEVRSPGLQIDYLAEFTGAEIDDENFYIYKVSIVD